MALDAGSISVTPSTGAYTGTGLAKAILDAYVAKPGIAAALAGVSGTHKGTAVTQLAELCAAVAEGVVAHVVANAVVTVSTAVTIKASGDGGLQRVPDPATPGATTDAPSFDKALADSPFSGTGTVA